MFLWAIYFNVFPILFIKLVLKGKYAKWFHTKLEKLSFVLSLWFVLFLSLYVLVHVQEGRIIFLQPEEALLYVKKLKSASIQRTYLFMRAAVSVCFCNAYHWTDSLHSHCLEWTDSQRVWAPCPWLAVGPGLPPQVHLIHFPPSRKQNIVLVNKCAEKS